jgi:hypothetical protein
MLETAHHSNDFILKIPPLERDEISNLVSGNLETEPYYPPAIKHG